MSRFTKILLLASVALPGCIFGNACEAIQVKLCDICPKNDYNAIVCKCLEDGVLTMADGPDGTWDSNDEAQQQCDRMRFGLRYAGDDQAAECKADKAYLDEWDVDACSDFGFTD